MPSASPIVNLSAYKFVPLTDLQDRRHHLKQLTHALNLRGTILLSHEGINLFVAGTRKAADRFLDDLHRDSSLADLIPKESFSDYQPFRRMLVKIRKEIISFGVPEVDPIRATSPKLPARELKRWLDEGRTVHLLDVRNDYEIEVGTFDHAIPAGVDTFREFPQAVRKLPERLKDEPVVMFCTGGIRCEKAGPFMEQAGFRHVYQLDGGILKYFEECGGSHYHGDCFVFDQRVAVNSALQETGFAQCYACQAVVSPEDQKSPHYIPGKSCPRCWQEPDDALASRLKERNRRLQQITQPLPGSLPGMQRHPMNVPDRYDGWKLLDFLCDWRPRTDRGTWHQDIAESRVIPSPRYGRKRRRMVSPEERLPLSPERPVRGGERLEHLQPAPVEPDVRADIVFLYEDADLLILSKPPSLPVHPAGPFRRNTLQAFLNALYHPQRPLPVHPPDADTSGIVLLARRRTAARYLHEQFERQNVSRIVTARVHGHPESDAFECREPVSRNPGPDGFHDIDPHGLPAHTQFRVLRRLDDGTSLLEAVPVTEHPHSIRLHLFRLGFPVVNDPLKHADDPPPVTDDSRNFHIVPPGEPPVCLHIRRLSLTDRSGTCRTFDAPPPPWAE